MANQRTRCIRLVASFDEHPRVELITREVIKQIYEDTGAVVLFQSLDNESNPKQLRYLLPTMELVIIYGRNGTDGLFEAMRRIVADYFIVDSKPQEDGSLSIKFLVDNNQSVNLLGTNDSTLRRIKNIYWVRVRMSAYSRALVEVRSTAPQALQAAVHQISAQLATSPADNRGIIRFFSPLLPDEVFRNILLKLSVKDLTRYKTVSREWKFQLTGQNFAEDYFLNKLSSQNSDTRVIVSSDRAVVSSFLDHEYQQSNGGVWTNSLLRRIKLPNRYEQICSFSGDGLVCMFMTEVGTHPGILLMWNPCTGQHSYYRVEGFIIYNEDNIGIDRGILAGQVGCYGCCYSFVDHDFKVVHLTCGPPALTCGRRFDYCTLDLFSIYAHTHHRFKLMLDDDFIEKESTFHKQGVCLNGTIHWLERSRIWSNRKARVLSLNIAEKVFQDLIVLPDYDINKYWPVHLEVLGRRLSLVLRCEMEDKKFGSQLWLMNEYGNKKSWTPYNVIIPYPALLFSDMRPLRISKNGGMLVLLETYAGNLVQKYVMYNSAGSVQWEHVYFGTEFTVPPMIFMESLFSP